MADTIPFVFVTSARTPSALEQVHRRLGRFLAEHPGVAAADVARTLADGRERFEVRRAFVAAGTAGLSTQLTAKTPSDSPAVVVVDPTPEPDAEGLPEPWRVAVSAAAAWCRGDAEAPCPADGRRIRLPGYPFEHHRPDLAEPVDGRPLDPLEQRRVFHDLVRRGAGREYVVTAEATTAAGLDQGALESAFAGLLRRHENLRVHFFQGHDGWLARVAPTPAADVVVGDPAAATDPFRLDGGPLTRLVAVPGPDGLRVLLAAYEPVAARVDLPALAAELLDDYHRLLRGAEKEDLR